MRARDRLCLAAIEQAELLTALGSRLLGGWEQRRIRGQVVLGVLLSMSSSGKQASQSDLLHQEFWLIHCHEKLRS
jgi:hypothetical protein